MTANFRYKSRRKFRGGSALVLVGVILVLAVVVFFLQKFGLFERKPGNPNEAGIMPWKEWRIREKLAQEPQTQTQTQSREPGIAGSFSSLVRLEGTTDSRGYLKFNISGDGAMGIWHGTFHNSAKRAIQIMGSNYSGFYCPDHITDENGNEDQSKLYYLCKGEFMYQETGERIVKHRAGDMYIRIWVDKNKRVLGRMYLTSNEKNFHEYVFNGGPSKSQELIF